MKAAVAGALADAQQTNYDTYAEMGAVALVADATDKVAVATNNADRMHTMVHDLMLDLYEQYK